MAGVKYFSPNAKYWTARDNLRGRKSLGPLKMSLEMARKVIVPPKKNYIPQFLKQRNINSFKEEAVQKRRNIVLTSKTTPRTPQKSTLAGLEPAIPRFVV